MWDTIVLSSIRLQNFYYLFIVTMKKLILLYYIIKYLYNI